MKEKEEEVKRDFKWPYIPRHLPEVRKLLKEFEIFSKALPQTWYRPNMKFFPQDPELQKRFIQEVINSGSGTSTVVPTPRWDPFYNAKSPKHSLFNSGFTFENPKGPVITKK